MPALELDVISDIICPWCFIGKRRLEQALAEAPHVEAKLVYHPFLLDPSVPVEGVDLRERLRRKYGRDPEGMFDRVEEAARETGIPIDYTRIQRTPNTIAGHTLLRHALKKGTQAALGEALFTGYFLEGKDIGDTDTLAAIAAGHGFTDEEARSITRDEAELDQTRKEAETWARQGVSGVPFTIVGKRFAVSGAQSVSVFAEAIRRATSE